MVENQFAFDFSDLRSNANFMQRGDGVENEALKIALQMGIIKFMLLKWKYMYTSNQIYHTQYFSSYRL